MRLVGAIVTEQPLFGNFMLFYKGSCKKDLGQFVGHGTLPEMRLLTLDCVEKESTKCSDYSILDRIKGVWIVPQPLVVDKIKETNYFDRDRFKDNYYSTFFR